MVASTVVELYVRLGFLLRDKNSKPLKVWMKKERTQSGIIEVVRFKLLAWQRGSTEDIPVETFDALQAVV
jgi:hypothetical protein